MTTNSTTIEERLVEFINLASVETDGGKKVEFLYKIKELALNHGLLNKYFDNILAFHTERSPNVKKFVSAFIEDSCRYDVKLCPKAILSLNLLLNDSNNDVIKRSIQAANQFYKALVSWIVESLSSKNEQSQVSNQNDPRSLTSDKKPIGLTSLVDQKKTEKHSPQQNQHQVAINSELSSAIEGTWLMWLQITSSICGLLETTNNDGIRTHCIKFIETVILMQTPAEQYTDENFELNIIDHKITPVSLSEEAAHGCGVAGLPKNGVLFDKEHKLELVESAKKRFDQLVLFHGTSHISSVNLMATMQSLVVLAKQRYRLFMGRVIQATESLNNRLPPTLTESQVQSVKKFLKLQLTVMLKHPYSLDRYQLQITQLLQSVGSKQPEIHKVINEFKSKFGCDATILNNNQGADLQKRIKLEPGVKVEQKPFGSHSSQATIGKSKHLDLNKLTQELDEKEKRQIVVDSVKRILGDEKNTYIPPAQMEIKKKVLSTLANEFNNTECPKIIQDYIFGDLRNRHEISYAIIKKNYDVAAAKAIKRNINLLDDQELLKNYFECFNSYLSRAMGLKDSEERDIILPRLYSLKEEYYSMTNQGQESEDR